MLHANNKNNKSSIGWNIVIKNRWLNGKSAIAIQSLKQKKIKQHQYVMKMENRIVYSH